MDADKKRIWIRGQFVEVTDEVYRAYMQGDRKMRYFENDLKTERFVLGKEGQVVQIIPSLAPPFIPFKYQHACFLISRMARASPLSKQAISACLNAACIFCCTVGFLYVPKVKYS